MDNLIFIGYRIDCYTKDNVSVVFEEDKLYDLKEKGFSISAFPGKEWMFWSHVKSYEGVPKNRISVFSIKGEFQGDYRCPIDRSEIYKDLFKDSIDVPEGYVETVGKIMETKLFKELNKMFDVRITWGLFLGLG